MRWPELPGVAVYLVGGAVRDQLLGRPVHEYDWVVVGATVQQLLDAGYRQVGRDFPVFLHPDSSDEVALARTERKAGSGHTGFQVHAAPDVTLEADLARRDFTVNAIALGRDGAHVDPHGGLADLEARVLRHVTPAFAEDPLRVLRGARFLAQLAPWGFELAPETQAFMARMVASGELGTLSPERVWRELERALAAPAPLRFFTLLDELGTFGQFFPGWPPPRSGAAAWRMLEADPDADPMARWLAFAADAALAGQLDSQRLRAAPALARAPVDGLTALALALDFAPDLAAGAGAGAEAVAELLQRLDLYRRRGRAERVIAATLRSPTLTARAPALGDFWQAAAAAAAAVTGRDFAAPGVRGDEIGRRLAAARTAAVQAVVADRRDPA